MSEANRRPRIVMVAHSHVLGGIERHVAGLAALLAADGHDIAYAGPLDGWLGEAMRSAGHACLHLPMHGMYDPLSALRLAAFARRWRADVLHGHAQRGSRYAAWAGRWARRPVVCTAHSTNAWKWLPRQGSLVCVSEAVRAFLRERGWPDAALCVVYAGVPDTGRAAPPADGPPTGDRPLRLGMLARFERVKGQDVALAALAALRPHTPALLRLAGDDGTAWGQAMHTLARQLGVHDQVEFVGQTDNVPGFMASVDLMLAPSRRESLCLSLIEAAVAGRGAVGARVGGIPEVVDDGVTGHLVPPGDPAALAEAIRRIAHDAGACGRLGQAARTRYEAVFTEPAMQAGLRQVYDHAMAPSGPAARDGQGRRP